MSYIVRKKVDAYTIIETDTNLEVKKCLEQDEARRLARSLNLGSGFQGWTPTFFTNEFKQKERPTRM